MRIFDPHIHMTSRTTDDYERMAAAGVLALVEPAFWLGQPRTGPQSFADYFDSLIGWEPFRASQYGIRARAPLRSSVRMLFSMRSAPLGPPRHQPSRSRPHSP